MKNMIDVKIIDLVGPALDWAVAKVMGFVDYPEDSVERGSYWHLDTERAPFGRIMRKRDWRPSTDWNQGGPILAKNIGKISSLYPSTETWPSGEELLPWAMRAFVQAELKCDTMKVPESGHGCLDQFAYG
ncbi:MAG: phage protein NinX family protein [Hafnia sp.]